MANKYAVASGSWSSTSTWSDTDGGGGGAAVPADGDAVFISAGVSVLMDSNLPGFTGLQTVTIRGSSGTPGMLYWADGTSGHLKVRTGYNIVGTSGTNKGRLLANSNGTWGGTTALANTYKATITLAGTAKIDAQYLDIALYCTQPTKLSVRTYKDKYDFTASGSTVDTTANTIDLGVTPPSENTLVMITTAAGTLPTPLYEDHLYYVRGVSGTKCKLSTQAGDTEIIDLTATGSGTCSLITGHTNTGTATINVLDDVTSDAPWSTTDGWDYVTLVDVAFDCDFQNVQLTTKNSGSLVLSANVDSVQAPGARVWLGSRNVQILSSSTSTKNIVDYTNNTTGSGVFQCAIINTAGSQDYSALYDRGIYEGTGHTVSGTLRSLNVGMSVGRNSTVSGVVMGCYNCVDSQDVCTVSGVWAGAIYGCYYGYGYTISGTVYGVSVLMNYSPGWIISGTVMGGSGVLNGSGHLLSGKIYNCVNASVGANNLTVTGQMYANQNCFYSWGGSTLITGAIGYTSDGAAYLNQYDFYFEPSSYCGDVVLRGAKFPASPSFYVRNTIKTGNWGIIYSEDNGRTLGASKAWHAFGTVTKQTGTVRAGGAASALQVDPLSNCGAAPTHMTRIKIFEWTELSVPASSMTRSVWMRGFGWSSWPTASELWFEAEYVSDAIGFARTTAKSTAVLTDNSTWVQFSVTFTPAAAAHVRYRAWLGKYAASSGVYVDAQLS